MPCDYRAMAEPAKDSDSWARRVWNWLGIGERSWEKKRGYEVQPAKTLWDFLQLLIVPLMLVLLAYLFNDAQAKRENAREDERAKHAETLAEQRIEEDRELAQEARRDDILQVYLTQMNDLMLHRHLVRAWPGSTVKNVARSLTLTTLRRLDGKRKGEVVRFLYEANLLRPYRALDLTGADLQEADLVNSELFDTSFARTDLRGAHFGSASLVDTDFTGALLANASFRGSELSGVQFVFADLTDAHFDHAHLLPSYSEDAGLPSTLLFASCLTGTSFVGAKFVHADLGESEGKDVDFSAARFRNRFLGRRFKRSVLVEGASLTQVNLDGAQDAPRGWGRTVPSTVKKSEAEHPCAGLNLTSPATTAQPPIRHLPLRPKKRT